MSAKLLETVAVFPITHAEFRPLNCGWERYARGGGAHISNFPKKTIFSNQIYEDEQIRFTFLRYIFSVSAMANYDFHLNTG